MRTTVAGASVMVAQIKEAIAARIPLRRYSVPEEVARLMPSLAALRKELAGSCLGCIPRWLYHV
jgi:hypothetical protein